MPLSIGSINEFDKESKKLLPADKERLRYQVSKVILYFLMPYTSKKIDMNYYPPNIIISDKIILSYSQLILASSSSYQYSGVK